MATLPKLLLLLLTVIVPGGLVALAVYYIIKQRKPDLDFSDRFRRVPIMRDRRTRQVIVPRRVRA